MAEVVRETARPQTQAGSRQRKWARWAGWLASALFLLGLGGLLVLLLMTAAELRLWGYQSYVIYGGSMEPTIKRGSLMLAKPVKMDDLQVGDIIAFRKPGNGIRVVHRIVGIREEDGQRYFETKGDASSGRDAQKVSMDDGVQQLAYDLPYLGYFVHFAKGTTGMILLLVLPAAGMLALHWPKSREAAAETQETAGEG